MASRSSLPRSTRTTPENPVRVAVESTASQAASVRLYAEGRGRSAFGSHISRASRVVQGTATRWISRRMTVSGVHRSGAGRRSIPPFQTFLEANRAPVYRFLVVAVGPQDADDVFQETFLAALKAYRRLTDGTKLDRWILTIASRKAIDHHRGGRAGRSPARTCPRPPPPIADRSTPTIRSGGRSGRCHHANGWRWCSAMSSTVRTLTSPSSWRVPKRPPAPTSIRARNDSGS